MILNVYSVDERKLVTKKLVSFSAFVVVQMVQGMEDAVLLGLGWQTLSEF
jgi:hypothetical protein